MKNYILAPLLILAFILLSCEQDKGGIPKTKENSKYIAYYFHPTGRCVSCLNIESFTKELIETKNYNKTIIFKSINVDDEENKHFKKDYELIYNSVILVRFENGSEKNWKNLDSVWSFSENKEQFLNYAEKEINNFIKE